jgi:hypothetical protein
MNEPERNVEFFTAATKGQARVVDLMAKLTERHKLKTERYDPQSHPKGYEFTIGKNYDVCMEDFVDGKFWYMVYNDDNEPTIVRADDFYLHASFDKPVCEDDKKLHTIAMCDVRKEYQKLGKNESLFGWEPTKEELARWKRLAYIGLPNGLPNIDDCECSVCSACAMTKQRIKKNG